MRKQINLQTGIGLLIVAMAVLCTACGGDAQKEPVTLVYASGDYTRINPAMDEHGEINLLLFDGITERTKLLRDWQRAGNLTRLPVPIPFIWKRGSGGMTASLLRRRM